MHAAGDHHPPPCLLPLVPDTHLSRAQPVYPDPDRSPLGAVHDPLAAPRADVLLRSSPCVRPMCTERCPTVAAPWARRTLRLAERLRAGGLALGGEMGARLGHRLGLRARPATLLRLGQEASTPAAAAPQVLGVDAWAWRRGQRDGTILVHLEDHQVLDRLPERSADMVAQWLAQHPTVTIGCRDRRAL
jgi:hypothetical protein